MQSVHVQTVEAQQIQKQVSEDIIRKVKASIEDGINCANRDIPVECFDERNK